MGIAFCVLLEPQSLKDHLPCNHQKMSCLIFYDEKYSLTWIVYGVW